MPPLPLRPLLLLLLAGAAAAGKKKGVVGIGASIFDKVVDGSRTTLVCFNKEYPSGDEDKAFEQFAETVAHNPDILIIELCMQDDNAEDRALRTRYGVKKEALPAFRLFPKGGASAPPVAFGAAVKEGELARWVKEEGGVYIGLPGCLERFDDIATRYVSGDKTALLKEAEAAYEEVSGEQKNRSARYYMRVMRKIKEQGADAIGAEKGLLEKLKAANVTTRKKEALEGYRNIVASFLR